MLRKWAPGFFVGSVLLLTPAFSFANLILNGDFETNTAAGTIFNSNGGFNAAVSDAFAFGAADEIDLVMDGGLGLLPQSGHWKVGLHTQTTGDGDAVSLTLASPLVMGQSYDLRFYSALLLQFDTGVGPTEIGLSNAANDFGTLIFSGVPTSNNEWTQFDHTFLASSAATYLTVRTGLNDGNIYNFVDNFTLDESGQVPEPSTLALLASGLLIAVGRGRQSRPGSKRPTARS